MGNGFQPLTVFAKGSIIDVFDRVLNTPWILPFNDTCLLLFVIFLGGTPTCSICHLFRLSIRPSVCPSVVHHILSTVHHLILIFGAYV